MKLLVKKALLLYTGIFSGHIQAQNTGKDEGIKKAVTDQYYIFNAQTVLPLGSSTRQLTPDYDVRITKDSIVAYLPYFGRAYSAPIGQTEGGIKFKSKRFDYTSKERKGGWDIQV